MAMSHFYLVSSITIRSEGFDLPSCSRNNWKVETFSAILGVRHSSFSVLLAVHVTT